MIIISKRKSFLFMIYQILGVQDDDDDWVNLDISWEINKHGNGQVEKILKDAAFNSLMLIRNYRYFFALFSVLLVALK